ncbi:DUF2163 domain-containing protein [Vibrio sp. ER1A]|uniref:DUF2163 domain-containing protein n=1 Tax=Vibrio sp. ER1A TaxID=1517681 RepID=UPI0004DD07C9|nr:DUF2163 domain-containing protein [Vibrio sp. ER1A]KFA99234.1 hypothetical protein HW45_05030 [Vibrio sp. ER1A]
MSGFYCSAMELDLRSITGEIMRLTDAPYDVEYDGNTYQAFGTLLSIDRITVENTLSSKALNVTLSGISVDFQESVNNNTFRRKPVKIYKCFVPEGSNVIQDMKPYWVGLSSTPETDINYRDGFMALKLSCKSIFDLDKTPSLMRANNSTHQALHNGDKFFQYATVDQDEDVMWRQP